MSKEDSERKLVAALATGNKTEFDSLLKSGADIKSLNRDMKEYASTKHFNMSAPLSEDARKSFNEMVNDLHAGKYAKDTKDINFPGLAAYGGNVKLMDKLIEEQPTAQRNFNQSLGARPAHPVLHAITNGGPEVANLLLDNARDLGIDTSKIRTGIADGYNIGDIEQTAKYLEKIPKLSKEDLEDLSKSMNSTARQVLEQNHARREEFYKITKEILRQVALSPKGLDIIKNITEGLESTSPSGDFVDKKYVNQLQIAALNIQLRNETNPFSTEEDKAASRLVVEKLARIGGDIGKASSIPIPKEVKKSAIGIIKSIAGKIFDKITSLPQRIMNRSSKRNIER